MMLRCKSKRKKHKGMKLERNTGEGVIKAQHSQVAKSGWGMTSRPWKEDHKRKQNHLAVFANFLRMRIEKKEEFSP